MRRAREDLQVDNLDIQNNMRRVVDGDVCRGEAGEFFGFRMVVLEVQCGFFGVGVEISLPGVVGAGEASAPGFFGAA